MKRLKTIFGVLKSLEEILNPMMVLKNHLLFKQDVKYGLLVKPEQIDDLEAHRLARDIRKKIEEELDYPGHIKVTVIRETRAVEYAK